MAWFLSFSAVPLAPRIIYQTTDVNRAEISWKVLGPALALFFLALILASLCGLKAWKNRAELRRRVKSLGFIPILIMLGALTAVCIHVMTGGLTWLLQNSAKH